MKTVFISNYINHHQLPFSEALYQSLGDEYRFIQTEPMEEERLQMGWGLDVSKIPYLAFSYREEERCRELLEEADLVLAGWTKRTDLFLPRLSAGKLTFRVSERIYREGQWKAVSPRGLSAKYREHVKYRGEPVYLLCAGAYVASDFSLLHAYPGKMLKFGYFPPLRTYEGDALFAKKRRDGNRAQMVWAGRMIGLKHPEYAVRLAGQLRQKGRHFHIHMIGGGPLEEELKDRIAREGLTPFFTLYGFLPPERVRDVMEECGIFLFTSNYLEGWGSVLNEAMNSGCCAVANAQIGAVPFLIADGKNGVTYRNGSYDDFASKVEELLAMPWRAEAMGRAAYETIATEWNARTAAARCLAFYEGWKRGQITPAGSGPLSVAPKLSARWKYNEGKL